MPAILGEFSKALFWRVLGFFQAGDVLGPDLIESGLTPETLFSVEQFANRIISAFGL